MKELDIKINKYFGGKVVRKDLTSQIKGSSSIPTYVLEYLLGQYCTSDDEETINKGVETVKNIIKKHFVHREESQLIKSTIRENGSHRIIDKVEVSLNDRMDQYEANFINLGLKKVPINDDEIKKHPKLLSGGVWCIITMGYVRTDEREGTPWIIESLKPIQISNIDLEEYKTIRKEFNKEEWMSLLLQTLGLNPDEFPTFRSKLLQLIRLVPFCENNYNFIELGPKGTGKSHIYSEMSPHGILISGGEVSKAKLFVNNSTGNIGLVGYWDVVTYDEFTGRTKKIDRGLVDIMKNYMANKTFSRGINVYTADASIVFVGNTDHSVPYMLKHSDLFDSLPKDYHDSAFLDRIHCYSPGWEVNKLRNEMFTSDYGFIVDYLSEVMKDLRKEDFMKSYKKYFNISDTITTRDETSIEKTFSGLIKVLYPDGIFTESDSEELLKFSIESRRRVKDELRKMDETFERVDFTYEVISTGKMNDIMTLETVEYGSVLGKNIKKEIDSTSEIPSKKKELVSGQIIIRDNQSGISYDKLFGDYLIDFKKITLKDPYIRLPYQLRNLMEFTKLLIEKKNLEDEVELHLITSNEEDYLEDVKSSFNEIQNSLESVGVKFTYEFDNYLHDRSIQIDTNWKILLGRGLDIFQKTNGWNDISEFYQEKRLCKECEVTFIET